MKRFCILFVLCVLWESTIFPVIPVNALSCQELGLPRTAIEYFSNTTPNQGERFEVCIDQAGVAYFPIPLIVGINAGEYLEYVEVNPATCWSQYSANRRPCDGNSQTYPVTTRFTAFRFSPLTMQVNQMDGTFSSSTGCTYHSANTIVRFLAFGSSASCIQGPASTASVNLDTTFFRFNTTAIEYIVVGSGQTVVQQTLNETTLYASFFGTCAGAQPFAKANLPFDWDKSREYSDNRNGSMSNDPMSFQIILQLSSDAPRAPIPPSGGSSSESHGSESNGSESKGSESNDGNHHSEPHYADPHSAWLFVMSALAFLSTGVLLGIFVHIVYIKRYRPNFYGVNENDDHL